MEILRLSGVQNLLLLLSSALTADILCFTMLSCRGTNREIINKVMGGWSLGLTVSVLSSVNDGRRGVCLSLVTLPPPPSEGVREAST